MIFFTKTEENALLSCADTDGYKRLSQKIRVITRSGVSVAIILLATAQVSFALPASAHVMGVTATPQQTTVSGKVVDEKGQPLPGVTITVKGTQIAQLTNSDGGYSISVPQNGSLIFSFIGFKQQEIAVGGRSVINVTLGEETTSLDEVVVIGYGTAKKSDVVGSVASVSVKDMKQVPSNRVDQLLQGRAAGVQVQTTSASPNASVNIRVRGSNSLSGGNNPLTVIDGFIGGDLSSLNPNDIASVEVLKDAAATAIYGSRGANGVILVTTKIGSGNKVNVSYNGFVNFQTIRKKLDLMNAAEYAETVNKSRLAPPATAAPFTQAQIDEFRRTGGTDWQDEIFKPATQQQHQLSISGASGNTNYFISGNVVDNNGILINSSFKRYSIRSNVQTKLSERFTTGINLFVTKSEDHPGLTSGFNDASPVQSMLLWAPTLPVYQPGGGYTEPATGYGPRTVYNPVGLAVEPIRDNIGYRTELNTFVSYNIIKGLVARVQFGYRLTDNENSTFTNNRVRNGIGNNSASINNSRGTSWQNTNQLTYNTKFGAHDLGVTAVYERMEEVNNGSNASTQQLLTDATTYYNLGLGSIPAPPGSNYSRRNLESLLGRITYGFKNKYLLNVAARRDGSSVFGANNKWSFFPSAGFAWRIEQEDFMKSITAISLLKFRAGFGVTGNQGIGPYGSIARLGSGRNYPIGGASSVVGVGLNTIGNPDLKWEKTAQTNFAIDLGLFNNRVTATAEYYNKQTSDLLMGMPLPSASGYGSVTRNIGKVENKGFEFTIGGDPFIGKFKWNTSFNITFNRNKVVELSGGATEQAIGTTGFPNFGNTVFLTVGKPMGILKGYIQEGIYSEAEAAEAARYGRKPGFAKFRDLNNDGIINDKDVDYMGNAQPNYTFGWTNNLSYGNFDMNIFIQGSQGNTLYNMGRIRNEKPSSDADATSRRVLNAWTPQNQNTDVPSLEGTKSSLDLFQSSRWIEDGSYIRLKALTLGYNLPKSILSKAKISNVRFYVTGVNLLTITKYNGYDPESATGVDQNGGIDISPYPTAKIYTIGANVTF